MKYIKKGLVFLILLLVISGCESTSNYKVITCSKKASLSDSETTADLEYKIYYEGDYVKKTISTEKITSNSSKTLSEYKNSYNKVFEKYKDIKYYDNTVVTKENSVISTTIINYDKVDSKKIIAIEGEEGNIFNKEGKVKLETLLKLYKKYGSSCDD